MCITAFLQKVEKCKKKIDAPKRGFKGQKSQKREKMKFDNHTKMTILVVSIFIIAGCIAGIFIGCAT